MKPIHGNPPELWCVHGLKKSPPIDCDFKINDKVIFTNDYGISFAQIVIGFADDDSFQGRFIHCISEGGTWEGSAGWFPHRPNQLQRAT